MSEPAGPPDPESIGQRLDPDAAAASATPRKTTPAPRHVPVPVVIDTRRYRWAIGGLGFVLVLALSVYEFAKNGIGTAGVPAGKQLHAFSAPLANSSLDGDANTKPPCTVARHDPRAMNVCLMVKRAPLVLAFFVSGSDSCKKQVDVMQRLSARYPQVQFAAVAVHAGHAETKRLVRARGWTIPVAYDRDGAIGEVYGVSICPLLELARRGGTVGQELIGEHWLTAAALAPRIDALVRNGT